MSLNFFETGFSGLSVVEHNKHFDKRGSFSKLFCLEELKAVIGNRNIHQVNLSYNEKQGCLRGIHFQKRPYHEMKLVKVLKGAIFDVAVDLNTGKYFSQILSAENQKMMLLSEEFGHGFQTLEPQTEILYLHTGVYKQEMEGGINPLDPNLAICWPLPIEECNQRDMNLPNFSKICFI
ncbi:MAG: dTDP-4-dehydrorhamnose 3-epimerase [Chlamydiae bacterium]|nr:dTDP-4-dehydrorhamnose 3-epimerase [Chlamydiota bacterium]